jgi:hypothetical protein
VLILAPGWVIKGRFLFSKTYNISQMFNISSSLGVLIMKNVLMSFAHQTIGQLLCGTNVCTESDQSPELHLPAIKK